MSDALKFILDLDKSLPTSRKTHAGTGITLVARNPTFSELIQYEGLTGWSEQTLWLVQHLLSDWEGVVRPDGTPVTYSIGDFEQLCQRRPDVFTFAINFLVGVLRGMGENSVPKL